MKKLLFALLLLFTFFRLSAQTNLYVDSSVTASGAGTSWATAYKTLNEALINANNGSNTTKYVISIAKGTYYPGGVQSSTNRDSSFIIFRSNIKLLGAYPSGGGTRDTAINHTILSGDIGSATDSTDNSYHVMVITNVITADSIILDGLTFTKGVCNGTVSKVRNGINVPQSSGGALYVSTLGSPLYMQNCIVSFNSGTTGVGVYTEANLNLITFTNTVFRNNTTTDVGGAVYSLMKGNYVFDNCTFLNNIAGQGGGIRLYSNNDNCNFLINNCNFNNNIGSSAPYGEFSEGGGISYVSIGTGIINITISNSTFLNDSSIRGAGIFMQSQYPASSYPSRYTITNCNFTGNHTLMGGGGAYIDISTNSIASNTADTACKITQCTFSNNVSYTMFSNYGGAGVFINSPLVTPVTQCIFSGNTATYGGGIFGTGNIANCTFSNNTAFWGGGIKGGKSILGSTFTQNTATLGAGIYTSGLVQACNVTSNSATNGGGIFMADGATIKKCSIKNNTATSGGGVYNNETTGASLSACTISGNSATTGGGIYNNNASSDISNCLISGNYASSTGGAMYNYNGSSPRIINCTITADSAVTAPGIYNGSATAQTSSPKIINSIVWEGPNSIFSTGSSTPGVIYSDIQGGYAGTANISTDPMFLSPVAANLSPDTLGNYTLPACSPNINTGIDTSISGTTDILGNTRTVSFLTDMGAYENQQILITSITGDSVICVTTTGQLANSFSGGSWTSSNPAIATVDSTGKFTGVASGVDTILYTYNAAGCGNNTIHKRIVINAAPTIPIISGIDSICVLGGTSGTSLSASPTGGTWSISNTIATINSSGFVQAANTGGSDTAYYKVTNGFGCSSKGSKVIHIIAHPVVAAITSRDYVCVGDTIILRDSTPGGVWWEGSNSVSQTGVFGSGRSGLYTVVYTVTPIQNCFSYVTKQISVIDPPTAEFIPPSSMCIGTTKQLSSNSHGVWASLDTTIATVDTNGIVHAIVVGTVTIQHTVTNASGCKTTSSTSVTIHPNPYIDIIYGPDQVCGGAAKITLTNSAAGGHWYTFNSDRATVNSTTGVVTGWGPGVVTISYAVTNQYGCGLSVTKDITVLPVPEVHYIQGSTFACPGAPMTLVDTTSGGVWSNSPTSLATIDNTGTFYPISSGIDTVKYTVISQTNFCAQSETLIITINPAPAVKNITGSGEICAGTSTLLRDSTIGGIWTSSDTSLAIVNSGGSVTGRAAGIDTIKYYKYNGQGCTTTVAKPIVIDALPDLSPIDGPTRICIHGTFTFSDTANDGVWISNQPAIATIDSTGFLTADTTGTVKISYSLLSAAGCKDTVFKTIIIGAPDTVNIVDSICHGNHYDFDGQSIDTSGVYTHIYQSIGGCDSTRILTLTMKITDTLYLKDSLCYGGQYDFYGQMLDSTGTYVHVFSSVAGCDSAISLSLQVTNIDTSMTLAGTVLTVGQANASYQWVDCATGSPLSGQTTQSFNGVPGGSYAVAIQLNNCAATSACYNIPLVGVKNVNAINDIQLYPNPTNGKIILSTGNERAIQVSIKDITGRVVEAFAPTDKISNIDLSSYPAGTYLVDVLFDGEVRYTQQLSLVK